MTVQHSRHLSLTHNGSCDRRVASLEGIPLDVAHLVADHSSIQDLRALSTVSKPLRDLLSDPGIWKKLYRKSPLFLPPGPYDWQSTPYLVNALLRAEKLYSVWPSSSSRPEVLRTRCINFGCDASLSVLFGRWLLVAEGSTLVCYDSQSRTIPESAETLFNECASRRILRIFSVGSVREEGMLAFAVLLFNDSFTIAKVLMERGKPSSIQTIFTSAPVALEGWTELAHVRLYHRLLVVNIGKCSSDRESSGHPVIMDINTMRRYHIPASTADAAFDPMHTVTFFFATKTHLVKVKEFSNRFKVRFKMECFPLPTAHETPESDILYPSHQSRVVYGPKLRECVVIHESPVDLETGKMSFALCGLNTFSDGSRLEIMDVLLEPDGSISFMGSGFNRYFVSSFCIGLRGQHACGVALRTDGKPLVFALDYHGPGSVSLRYSILDHQFPTSELLALDAFGGTAFFSRRSGQHTSVEMVDFIRDVGKAEGRPPEYVLDSELKMICECGECYLTS